MASAGAKISDDAARISDGLRSGKGTIGKLLNDDELYQRATAIAKQAEEIATDTRQVVEQARKALDEFQSKDGPVQGLTASLKQTMDERARGDGGLRREHGGAEAQLPGPRLLQRSRVLQPRVDFAGRLPEGRVDRTKAPGGASASGCARRSSSNRIPRCRTPSVSPRTAKRRLDSAMATFLDQLPGAALIVEGYSQQRHEGRTVSTRRGYVPRSSRDYLIGRFQLDPL